jgi:antitoxin (DNA-binding transcriptional repressor) of toxin-antitoxin stability system
MAQTLIEVHDLPARWPEIVSLALAGADVIVTEGDSPRVRLVPVSPDGPRTPGLHAGAIRTTDDFDAPLPDDFWAGTP